MLFVSRLRSLESELALNESLGSERSCLDVNVSA